MALEELIDLLGREDERDDNLFFERRDIEEGILLKDSSSHQETKEAPCDGEHMVHGGGLQGEIGSHVKEEGRVKGAPDRLHSDADNDQRGGGGLCRGCGAYPRPSR